MLILYSCSLMRVTSREVKLSIFIYLFFFFLVLKGPLTLTQENKLQPKRQGSPERELFWSRCATLACRGTEAEGTI